MAITASSLFSRDELSFRDMLEDNGIFVDDRWFPKDSSEIDRVRYHASFLRRQERNRRRRERRCSQVGERKPREARSGVSQAPDVREANRLPLERRKCLRRSTLAACPTVGEIRTAWRYRNESAACRVRLGALLMDLECHVDNSLIVFHVNRRPKIIGRNGGVRQWIRENCPELEPHYKTLQRIKGVAKRLRQRIGVLDPVPLSALLDAGCGGDDLSSAEVHVQPRDGSSEEVVDRFAWEKSDVRFDADGRAYLEDENYYRARHVVSTDVLRNLPVYRVFLEDAIILIDKGKCTNENYVKGPWIPGACREAMARNEAAVRRVGRFGGGRGEIEALGEMFAYIGRHPEFVAQVAVELARDVGRGVRETLLPERTNRRIVNGEKVGLGRFLLDVMDAYTELRRVSRFYSWGKSVRF